jgi:phosphoribosylglycinamide formyltransferase-1
MSVRFCDVAAKEIQFPIHGHLRDHPSRFFALAVRKVRRGLSFRDAFPWLSHLRAMVRIAILASGSGTNAEKLMERFNGHPSAEVALLGCDRAKAGVLQRAWDAHVPIYLLNGAPLKEGVVLEELQDFHIDLLVLAGFMRLVPAELVRAYPDRIINIHPSLLPRYGGKGMYGDRVHEAVIAAGDRETGITVHLVNERYDEGRVLFQAKCPVLPHDDAAALAQRVHALEHAHYPAVVEAQVDLLRKADRSVQG